MLKYYDNDSKLITYDVGKPFNKTGTHAKIYDLGDGTCLKRFLYPWDIYDEEMFRRYMSLDDLANFYKILEVLYNKNNRIKGYIAPIYENTVDSVFSKEVAYIIDNFDGIYKSIARLTDKNIEIDDLIPYNLIFGDNIITVIDVDQSKVRISMDKQMLYHINKMKVLVCLLRLFRANLLTYYGDLTYIGNRRINELFSVMDYEVVSRKLAKYKTPYDYITDNGKLRNI